MAAVRRPLLLAVLLLALAAPSGALAQSSPFGPLPQADQPTQTTVTPPDTTPTNPGDRSLSTGGIVLIGAGVLALFGVIGWAILRDASGSTSSERGMPKVGSRAERRDRTPDPGLAGAAGRPTQRVRKTQSRAKGRAQRAARKRNR